MSKISTLAGVAHNLAHHAGSDLSYTSPHLAQALRSAGADATENYLLAMAPYPPNAREFEPLRLAPTTLQVTARALLEKHGFSGKDVTSLFLYATPAPWDKTGYSFAHPTSYHFEQRPGIQIGLTAVIGTRPKNSLKPNPLCGSAKFQS